MGLYEPFLEAGENGLDSSSIKYKFKRSHQIDLAELSCWRSLENLMGVRSLKSSAVSWKGVQVREMWEEREHRTKQDKEKQGEIQCYQCVWFYHMLLILFCLSLEAYFNL